MRSLPAAALVLAAFLPLAAAQEPADPNARLMAILEESKADAERVRGLRFLSDVPARKMSKEDFKQQMLRDIRRVFGDGDDLAHMERLLQILGVLPEGTGILDLTNEFFPAAVAANYDPTEKRISFLKGMRSEKSLRSVMVHELTHALQDQHFNLTSMVFAGELTFDRLLALGGLVEGDAEATQQTYAQGDLFALAPLPMIKALGEAQAKGFLDRTKGFPWGVARPFIFQYVDGIVFVEHVKRRGGGLDAVNRMFRDPPASTEQVLHPERYLERDYPTRILPPDPPPGHRVLVSNVLGELGVYIVLRGHLGDRYRSAMAAGWDGDRILLLRRDGEDGAGATVVVWYTTWDTEEDAAEFADAAKAMYRVRRPGATEKEVPGRGIYLQTSGRSAHAVVLEGCDVLLAEGLPLDGFAPVLQALRGARKETLVLRRTEFGEGR